MPPRLLFFFSAHTLMQSQPKHLEGRTAGQHTHVLPGLLLRVQAGRDTNPRIYVYYVSLPRSLWRDSEIKFFILVKGFPAYVIDWIVSLHTEIFIPQPQKETLFGNKVHNLLSYDKNHREGKFIRKKVDIDLTIGKVPQWGGCWSPSHQAGHKTDYLYPFPRCPQACYFTRKASVRGHCHYFHFKHQGSIFLSLYSVKTNSAT